ncbi:transcription factor Adf-1-like isoform X2 [Neocloeon triangulifer]|uniref:transcription factor Adf-1-like isoform X2 n=1 Tax=Neocloeon triangulifer TaxID=2078957 RepID=UPI00286F2003|nr:transcription factor Adf-1-like isoform X2 [Neocloeon triangulifer]
MSSDIKLINLVKEFPDLYDTRRPNYKDTVLKETIWTEIANNLSTPVQDVKTRWRSLRDRFTREKKAAILSNSPDYTGKPFKPWPLVEHMNFLWSFISHREGHGNFRSRKVPSTEYSNIKNESKGDSQDDNEDSMMYEWVVEDDNIGEDHSRLVETTLEEPSPSAEQSTSTRSSMNNIAKLQRMLKYDGSSDDQQPSEKRRRPETAEDEDMLFCKSIVHTLHRLNPKQKAYAKLQILKVLYEAEFGGDDDKQ